VSRPRPKTRRRPRSNPRGILKLTSKGFGFVKTAEGEFFVPASKLRGAFDGDLVELAAAPANPEHRQPERPHAKTGEKPTARVVRILERAQDTLVGRYEVAEPFGVVVPQDSRIPYDVFTMRAEKPHINDGDIVRVRITEYPTARSAALGVVEEVIGHEGDEALGVELIIARHKLATAFSDAALEQARKAALDIPAALADGYRDLRDRRVLTVDPVDARDFDDALSLEPAEGCLRLGVHIADVSRYVPWNSALDHDAQDRATSVYLVDRVLPMLPEELSADICSLKPGEDRLTMTVDLYLDAGFRVVRYEIYPAVIRSRVRLTYDEVQDILDRGVLPEREGGVAGDAGAADGSAGCVGAVGAAGAAVPRAGTFGAFETAGLKHCLDELSRIAQALEQKRKAAGGIDFVSTEAKVMLDEAGKPLEIVIRKKTAATSLIEEAMLLANTTVAKHLRKRGLPGLFRVHDKPSEDDLVELLLMLREFDYLNDIAAGDFVAGNPFCVQEVLARCKGRPEEELISSSVLRAMKRAIYQQDCEPHYALAAAEYCHFTSPIRRYPDLVVHRMLKVEHFGRGESHQQEVDSLKRLGERSSEAERTAEAAARESHELKIVEYLQDYIGCTFEAVVSGVTGYGFFVRLANTAEGLVAMRDLGTEYFAHDARRHTLTGEESGRRFRLGQKVRVSLVAADPHTSRLDFRLCD